MAFTVTPVAAVDGPQQSVGRFKFVTVDVTLDNSYPAGGYSITPASVGLTNIVWAIAGLATTSSATTAIQLHYNVGTNKLQAFNNVAGTPIPECGAIDLTTFTGGRVIFLGW